MADQVAVLTGGVSGIGLASAQALARSGMTVVIADAKGAVIQLTRALVALRSR